ncbi:ganglioside GM2 activator-like isoform X1 [Mya arenaria]|uniref:ganglioside GM2 activator-like isoform X1 n=1 Tax=Mya arenaria TaxID=6604 RepID=UPI0022E45A36|nr:ganglioside GM2 activator-like isoform X1 [Mya arenaria]XP_052794618.1 ganglioside GM2 activator-like isoform X1 [Mya arenaria]
MDIMAVLYFCVLGFLMMYVDADFVNLMEIEERISVETNGPYQWHAFKNGKFQWKLCNTTAVPVAVTSLSVEPNPIQFGQNISFSGAVTAYEGFGTTSSLETDMKVMMKLHEGEYYDVCVYKPEYCHITDVCDKLKKFLVDKCPPTFKRYCQCPFDKGTYLLPKTTLKIPTPAITVSGEFNITLALKESQKEIACLNIHLCLGQC